MRNVKKFLAMFLTMAILCSFIPMTVLAEGDDSAQSLGHSGNNFGEILIYNLGNREVSVEVDGSYTIQLENNAFFPYEIQFKCGGRTVVETFETVESTATIGSHVIGVTSDYDDENALSSLGFWIDGRYFVAKPEKKTFTNPMFMPFSLMPLTRINLTLDLRDLTPEQTKTVQVSARSGIDTAISGKTVLWNYNTDGATTQDSNSVDSYHPLPTGTVDMSNVSGFTMLVGDSGHQLDAGRIRYMVNVQQNTEPYIRLYLNEQDSFGNRTERSASYSIRNNVYNYTWYLSKLPAANEEHFLNFYSYDISGYSSVYTATVYTGLHDTEAHAIANGTDITTVVFADSDDTDSGYKADFSTPQEFTIVVKMGSDTVMLRKFTAKTVLDTDENYSVNANGLYESDRGYSGRIYAYDTASYVSDPLLPDVDTIYYTLKSGNVPDRNYFFYVDAYNLATGKADNSLITKVVRGHYDNPATATSQPDIKNQVVKTSDEFHAADGVGYATNFGAPVDFTVFIGNSAFKYRLIALENKGSNDVYFNVTGAAEITPANIYKIQAWHDSVSSQFNSQVLLVDEAVDLSNINPTFTTAKGLVAYVGETEQQTSGANPHDFDNKAVTYTVRSESGDFRKNYSVSFVKAVSGSAKLYATVDGQQPTERRVFFNPGTDDRHDVFVANIGDVTLTGLHVEIQNAVNVKLDDYWTVGGSGNDALDAFDAAAANSHGELSNTAKIRLRPTGLGAISGTLVISSTNGGTITFELTGEASEPKITTLQTAFDNAPAVKYVPYAFMIMSNNDYSWNRERFYWSSGSLPEGMVIRPSGELYGVPTQTGTFTFTVRAQYSDSRFPTSFATFTLTVLENTDTNVGNATDAGYTVMNYVAGGNGGTLTAYQDTLFRTEGPYANFMDFWMNGQKMVKDVDYRVEEGSTAITVLGQTFRKFGTGTHTIAGEFREAGDINRELFRASQNYTVGPANNSNNNTGVPANDSAGSSDTESDASDYVAMPQRRQAKLAENTEKRMTFRSINVDTTSLTALKQLARQATKEGKYPWLNADTTLPDSAIVDVRISINPALATIDLNLAGSTTSLRSGKTRTLFEKFFRNQIAAVISLSQKSDFGQPARICVKISSNIAIADLVFYSYNPETNLYTRIVNPEPYMDSNGYLHFTSVLANEIIISKGDLERK